MIIKNKIRNLRRWKIFILKGRFYQCMDKIPIYYPPLEDFEKFRYVYFD